MEPKTFDNIIAEISALEARIAAINARPFLPDVNSSRVQMSAANQAGAIAMLRTDKRRRKKGAPSNT